MALRFQKLTRPAVRGLTAGEKLNEHGITAERLKTGDVRYTVNIMVDGQRIHRVVGKESEGVTREQAERTIETLRTKAREGRLDLPTGRKVHRNLNEAAPDYIDKLREEDGKNINEKERHLTQHLRRHMGGQRIDKFSEFELKRYRKTRGDEGAAPATINREMATLSHLLKSAIRWRWMAPGAMPIIPKVTEDRKPIRILTEEQSDTLMKAAIADQDGRLWLFVACALNAAMRHSEILRIRYDNIDFDARRIFVPKAKAGQREQPITASLAAALQRQRDMEDDPDGWVFPNMIPKQAKSPHRTNMARGFARAVARAGLDPDKVTPHVMRHTAITRLVKTKVDLPTIQKISGHKTLAMVLRYVHVHGEHIDTAIETLNTDFLDAITPELHTPLDGKAGQQSKIVPIKRGKSAA